MLPEEPLPRFPGPWLGRDAIDIGRYKTDALEDMVIPDPRTVLERTLDSFTSAIREKPVWWEKVFFSEIVERWQAEASQQDVDHAMFDFALQQLRHQARQCGEDGIRPSPVPGVFESDCALGSGLQQHLLAALQPLRDVPDDQRDWHPGSEQQVLDLVHPSLFPLTYGLSRRLPPAAAATDPHRPQPGGEAQGTQSGAPPAAEAAGAATSAAASARAGGSGAATAGDGTTDAAPGTTCTGEKSAGDHAYGAPAELAPAATGSSRAEIASAVAATESWFSRRFCSWKTDMGSGDVIGADAAPAATKFKSDKFQWLPAEVLVGADGRVVFDSYVNNMHPERHAALYAATARLLGRMLPLLERTLSAATQQPQRVYVVPEDNHAWWSPACEEELWEDMKASGEAEQLLREWYAEHAAAQRAEAQQAGPEHAKPQHDKPQHGYAQHENLKAQHDGAQHCEAHPLSMPGEAPTEVAASGDAKDVDGAAGDKRGAGAEASEPPPDQRLADLDDDELPDGVTYRKEEALYDLFHERRVFLGPVLPERFEPPPPPPRVDLRGRDLQVVVKYAEIVLTPERPEYGGGSWHVEGMENEAIAASCIAYLAADNISDSRLHFRTMVADPVYEQNDDAGIENMYAMENEGPMNEPLGSVLCSPGRMLCWPNVFQHRVAPFRLADASRPGHRTIAVAFLVDPQKRVLSTRDVPPQQMEWHDAASRLGSQVPEEVKERLDALREFPVSLARAKELRLELMVERGRVAKGVTDAVFERTFNFCEH